MFGKRYIWTYRKGDLNLGPQALRGVWIFAYWLIAVCVQGWIFNAIVCKLEKRVLWSWNPFYCAKMLFWGLKNYGLHGMLLRALFWYIFVYFVFALIFDFLFRRTTLFGRIDDRGSHGDAHFADLYEIKQAGLISERNELLDKCLKVNVWCFNQLIKLKKFEYIRKKMNFCVEKLEILISPIKNFNKKISDNLSEFKKESLKEKVKDIRFWYIALALFVWFSFLLLIFNIVLREKFGVPYFKHPYETLKWIANRENIKRYSWVQCIKFAFVLMIFGWLAVSGFKIFNVCRDVVIKILDAVVDFFRFNWPKNIVQYCEKKIDENNTKGGGVVLGYWEAEESLFVKIIKKILFIKTKFTLRDTGPDHVHVTLPTRGGKGVTVVTDTSLEWQDSMVILDIKGENWQLSSGYRSRVLGQYCFRFEPTDDCDEEKIKTDIEHLIRSEAAKKNKIYKDTDEDYKELCKKVDEYYIKNKNWLGTARWNPLMDVHIATPNETAEIQQIATMLADPEGKGLKDYFDLEGYALLTGAITYELYYSKNIAHREPSLFGVRELLSKVDKSVFESSSINNGGWLARELLNFDERSFFKIEDDQYGVHPVIKITANTMARKAEEEFSGVVGTANSKLELFLDSTIGQNTNKGTFTIENIVNSDKPVSLYLIVPPTDIPRLRPLLRLFLVLLINGLTGKMVKDPVTGKISSGHIHRLLLLLDEFPQLKKMDQIQVALAQMAGYGLKAMIVTQSYTQLQGEYGKEETVSANCNVTMAGAPNDENTAKILSDMTGKKTEIVGHMSESVTKGKSASESISYSEHERPLMYPHDIRHLAPAIKDGKGMILKPGKLLVFAKGYPAILCEQALFFQNKKWLKRTKLLPPVVTINIKEKMYKVREAIENWQRDEKNAHKPVDELLKQKNNIALLQDVSNKVIRKWFSQTLRRNPKASTVLLSILKNSKEVTDNANIDSKLASTNK